MTPGTNTDGSDAQPSIRVAIITDPGTIFNLQQMNWTGRSFEIVGDASTSRDGGEMVVRTQPDIIIVDRYLPYDDADQTITLPAGRSIAFHDFFRYSFEKAFFERALAGYEEKSLDLCRGLRQQMPSLKLVLLTPYPFNAEKYDRYSQMGF